MSLGLNDLKKSSRVSTKTNTSTDGGAGAVSENWARGTRIARPWTTSELSKAPKQSARTTDGKNVAMTGEWADEHTATIHVFEMEAQSALAQLQDLKMELKAQAVELERKIKRAAMSPFEILRSVVQLVQK